MFVFFDLCGHVHHTTPHTTSQLGEHSPVGSTAINFTYIAITGPIYCEVKDPTSLANTRTPTLKVEAAQVQEALQIKAFYKLLYTSRSNKCCCSGAVLLVCKRPANKSVHTYKPSHWFSCEDWLRLGRTKLWKPTLILMYSQVGTHNTDAHMARQRWHTNPGGIGWAPAKYYMDSTSMPLCLITHTL